MAALLKTIRIDWRRRCGFLLPALILAAALAGLAQAQPRIAGDAAGAALFPDRHRGDRRQFFRNRRHHRQRGIGADRRARLRPRRHVRRSRSCRRRAGNAGLGRQSANDRSAATSNRALRRPISPAGPMTGSSCSPMAAPLRELRAIGSLFPAVAHLVVRADSPIRSLADLKGKTVAVGEAGSGSAADAAVLFEAAGLGGDVVQKNLRPGPGAAEVKDGNDRRDVHCRRLSGAGGPGYGRRACRYA